MSFAKIKSKVGVTVILGVGKVLTDKNTYAVVSEVEANEYGSGLYKFKVQGASKLTQTQSGQERWRTQRVWLTCSKDSVFVPLIKNLGYCDKVFFFGVAKRSEYTKPDTGQKGKSLFVNLEYIELIETASGEIPNTETAVDTDDEFDLDDF